MSNRLPISVYIIALNEADRIRHAIASVMDWVEEIIVVDSGSQDETVRICDSLGIRVIHNDWPGYGPQKRFAEAACRYDWVMNLDADESIDQTLRASISQAFANNTGDTAAYEFAVSLKLRESTKTSRLQKRYWRIKLYDRRRATMSDSLTNDAVHVLDGRTRRLTGNVVHRSIRSFHHMVAKNNEYTSAQAAESVANGGKPSRLAIVLTTPGAFLKCYLLRRECFRGTDGFVLSAIYAFQRFSKQAKIWELCRNAQSESPRPDPTRESRKFTDTLKH